jgi:hypothetical protein
MKNELPNKKEELFMNVNLLKKRIFIVVNFFFLARKYAQLKKTRHNRVGKQHSVDDDEEDIGM